MPLTMPISTTTRMNARMLSTLMLAFANDPATCEHPMHARDRRRLMRHCRRQDGDLT
jgi:hypothetical protein